MLEWGYCPPSLPFPSARRLPEPTQAMPTNPTSTVAFPPASVLAVLLALLGTADSNWFRGMAAENPADYANPLVGTAPLDDPQWIGNAPPPGEELYTGFTMPGPALPHHEVNLGPINKDLSEAAGNHGIIFPYTHAPDDDRLFQSPARIDRHAVGRRLDRAAGSQLRIGL